MSSSRATLFESDLIENIPLAKIEDILRILKQKEADLEQQLKFGEAQVIRDKINQYEQLKVSKKEAILISECQEHLDQLHKEHETEVNNYKTASNSDKKEIDDKANQALDTMKKRHSEEIEKFTKEFNDTYPKENPKHTTEIWNLKKRQETMIKKKEYAQAQTLQDQILNWTNQNNTKWLTEMKDTKYQADLKRLKTKQMNELHVLEQKIQVFNDEFESKRNKEIEQINKKYQHKEKNLITDEKCKKDEIILKSVNTIGKMDKSAKENFATTNN